jgi:hypothetical protein
MELIDAQCETFNGTNNHFRAGETCRDCKYKKVKHQQCANCHFVETDTK